MTIEITRRAAQQIERAKRWWLANRPYAQALFDSELRAAFAQIRTAPSSGHEYSRRRFVVRRILMPETRNHVYYRVVSDEVAQILTLWGAVRGRGPRL